MPAGLFFFPSQTSFISIFEPTIAVAIANGDIDPISHQPFAEHTTSTEMMLLAPIIADAKPISISVHTSLPKKYESPLRPRKRPKIAPVVAPQAKTIWQYFGTNMFPNI